ncbi:MAG: hypothetical protein CMQ38_08050 [Gammaproteobacteria bacterium]|nr:hypothetical protein [Gammaproteobacteria bacterium]
MADSENIEPNSDAAAADAEDYSEAERIINDADTGASTAGLPGEFSVDPEIAARRKARAVVGLVERVFRFFHKGLKYDEEVYRRGEEKLAPAIEKHNLTESLPFKYSEEVGAAAFLGELIWDSAATVAAMAAEEEKRSGKTQTEKATESQTEKPTDEPAPEGAGDDSIKSTFDEMEQ